MQPKYFDRFWPDFTIRGVRKRRPLGPPSRFVLVIPEPVDRREVLDLIRRRFPAFTLDDDRHEQQP